MVPSVSPFSGQSEEITPPLRSWSTVTMFSVDSGMRAGSSRDRPGIGRSWEGISVGSSSLISREFLIDLVSQGSVFAQYSLSALSALPVLLDREDRRLLLLLFLEEIILWVETKGVWWSSLAR